MAHSFENDSDDVGTFAQLMRKRRLETTTYVKKQSKKDDDDDEDDAREFQAALQRSTDQERLRYEEEEKYKKLQRTEKEIAAKQQLLSNTETAIAAETEEDEHATNQNTKLPIPEQKDSSSGPHLPHRSLSSQLYDPDTDLDNELESTQPTTTGADSETDVDGNENIEQVPCECCHHTIPSDKYGHLDVHYPCSETCGNLCGGRYCPSSKKPFSFKKSKFGSSSSSSSITLYPCGCVSGQ